MTIFEIFMSVLGTIGVGALIALVYFSRENEYNTSVLRDAIDDDDEICNKVDRIINAVEKTANNTDEIIDYINEDFDDELVEGFEVIKAAAEKVLDNENVKALEDVIEKNKEEENDEVEEAVNTVFNLVSDAEKAVIDEVSRVLMHKWIDGEYLNNVSSTIDWVRDLISNCEEKEDVVAAITLGMSCDNAFVFHKLTEEEYLDKFENEELRDALKVIFQSVFSSDEYENDYDEDEGIEVIIGNFDDKDNDEEDEDDDFDDKDNGEEDEDDDFDDKDNDEEDEDDDFDEDYMIAVAVKISNYLEDYASQTRYASVKYQLNDFIEDVKFHIEHCYGYHDTLDRIDQDTQPSTMNLVLQVINDAIEDNKFSEKEVRYIEHIKDLLR